MGPYGVPGSLSMGPYGVPGSRDSWTRDLVSRDPGPRVPGLRDPGPRVPGLRDPGPGAQGGLRDPGPGTQGGLRDHKGVSLAITKPTRLRFLEIAISGKIAIFDVPDFFRKTKSGKIRKISFFGFPGPK